MSVASTPWAPEPGGDEDYGITITAAGTAMTRYCSPALGGCGKDLPLDEFYASGNPRGMSRWRKSVCRDCENRRHRDPSVRKRMDQRARHRAAARLQEEHRERFRSLYLEELDRAYAENEEMLSLVKGVAPREPLKLRPGRRRPGQSLVSRIDTATCTKCHTIHDAGHACPGCGKAMA